MTVKSFKIFLFAFLSLQLNFADCAAGEEKSNKRKKEWKDRKVYKNRNFNKAFPELAEGFRLVDENLQDFMMPKLQGHHVYETTEITPGQQTPPLLHRTLERAEKHMVKAMQQKLKNVFYGYKDLSASHLNMLQYAKNYKHAWGEEITNNFGRDTDLFCNAIFDNHTKKISALIDLEVNINAKNCFGWTPLHCAASTGNATMIATLCSLHADIEATNRMGKTPLRIAFDNYGKDKLEQKRDYKKTIKILAAAGAKNTIHQHELIHSFYKDASGNIKIKNWLDDILTAQARMFISYEFAKRDNPSSLPQLIKRHKAIKKLL